MGLVKIYALSSCIVGAIQVASGFALLFQTLPGKFSLLFEAYGAFGAFGLLELVWLGVSTVLAVVFLKRGLPFLPPVIFVVFCLLHPAVGFLIPPAATADSAGTILAGYLPAALEIGFGLIYLMLNWFVYRSYIFVPSLFEK